MKGEIKRMFKRLHAGNQSTNIQAESVTVNKGITYMEVREIAMDLFKSNFSQLSEQATLTARERAEEITDKFLKELEKQNNFGVNNAQDPDFQHSLFTIQKEYARNGDKELGDLLVDLLVDRTKHDKRTILQIVLNESLLVAPKLTNEQIVTLGVIFTARYTMDNRVISIPILLRLLDTKFKPFSENLTKSQSCYQHLEYAGCGTVGLGEIKFLELFKNNYKGLFIKGFSDEDFNQLNINISNPNLLLLPCLHDNGKWQVNALNDSIFRELAKNNNLSDDDISKVFSIQNTFMMSDDEIRNYIISQRDYMEKIIDIWDNSPMKNFTLTSVGISIGHANIKRTTGEISDLSVWIN